MLFDATAGRRASGNGPVIGGSGVEWGVQSQKWTSRHTRDGREKFERALNSPKIIRVASRTCRPTVNLNVAYGQRPRVARPHGRFYALFLLVVSWRNNARSKLLVLMDRIDGLDRILGELDRQRLAGLRIWLV